MSGERRTFVVAVVLSGVYCLGYHFGASATNPNNPLVMFGLFVATALTVVGVSPLAPRSSAGSSCESATGEEEQELRREGER